MLTTVRAIVKEKKIEFLEEINLTEETQVLVTILPKESETKSFWTEASQRSLNKVWDNKEDEVYAQLLKK